MRRDEVQDEVIYRCIHAACARPLPRRVNFCPYCGTGQHAGVMRPSHVLTPRPAPPVTEKPMAPPPQPPAPRAVKAEPPPVPAPSSPPKREPVRLRNWLLALALLAAVWYTQRPNTRKIEERIDRAIAMAQDCRSGDAQAELIALRSEKASGEQLQRLQLAINDAATTCDRRAKTTPKRADAKAQSVRNLMAEAQREIARGDYRAASDKMEVCATMIDGGSRECSALKARADRLQNDMLRCVAAGREWIGERCQ